MHDDLAPLIIYHANCADGGAAAAAAAKAMFIHAQGTATHESIDPRFTAAEAAFGPVDNSIPHSFSIDEHMLPAAYGDSISMEQVRGRHVVIVDFSYPRGTIIWMAQQAKKITIIDHHKTAAKEFANTDDLPDNVHVIIDQDYSGATLTWRHFFWDAPPALLRHIEDRDLWRFAVPHTREVMERVFAEGVRPTQIDSLLRYDVGELAREGAMLLNSKQRQIADMILPNAHTAQIAGFDVPAVCAPRWLASDVGHALLENDEHAPFAAVFYHAGDQYYVSLRSSDDRVDVSVIAEQFGGGGHRNAAGFSAPASPICV